MDCYYCIVNLPGRMGADVCVLAASDDRAAMTAMSAQATHWVGFETVFLYFGERFVGSLVDVNKGFLTTVRPDADSPRSSRNLHPVSGERSRRTGPRPADARKAG